MKVVRIPQRAGVRLCFLITIFLIHGVVVKCDSLEQNDAKGSALTIVESPDNGEEDEGLVSVEGEEPSIVDETVEEFVPTDEWKIVKDGQRIPPGLHVQMDFKTGKKQAKRMNPSSDHKVETWDAGDKIGVINTEKPRYTRDELKAALKDFKYSEPTQEEKESKEKKVKENFRSYEDLKKAMKDIKLAVKTEGEIVRELTNKLNQSTMDSDQLKTILIDLEYYLHQIDNAQLFCDLGGMNTMLKLMNSTAEEIRESACHTMGAAMQSNAKVQVSAMESGVMHHLIRGLVTDPSKVVQRRMLYALSTMLRQFPFAQKKFLDEGGLMALATLFEQADSRGVQIKIVTLLTDLLTESDFNLDLLSSSDPVQVERSQQYKDINLREAMTLTGWCRLMTSLLQGGYGTEHDSIEKVVHAMSALAGACADQFSTTRPVLQALMQQYSELAESERNEAGAEDDFFSSIHSALQELVSQIHRDDL